MVPKPLPRPYRLHLSHILISLWTAVFLVITIGFALLLSFDIDNPLTSRLVTHVNASSCLTILRAFTEALSILLGALIAGVLDAVLWASASSKKGISAATFLGLVNSTGLSGLCELLFKWRRAAVFSSHRFVAMVR